MPGAMPGGGMQGMPGGGMPGGMPGMPGGMPGGGAPTADLKQFVVGSWRGQVIEEGLTEYIQSVFGADGSFTQTMQIPQVTGQTITVQGTWSVVDDGQGGQALQLTPTSWNPQQVCGFNGQCQPFQPEADTVQTRIIDQNRLQVPGGMFQRMG